jgi:hypothetical protein
MKRETGRMRALGSQMVATAGTEESARRWTDSECRAPCTPKNFWLWHRNLWLGRSPSYE